MMEMMKIILFFVRKRSVTKWSTWGERKLVNLFMVWSIDVQVPPLTFGGKRVCKSAALFHLLQPSIRRKFRSTSNCGVIFELTSESFLAVVFLRRFSRPTSRRDADRLYFFNWRSLRISLFLLCYYFWIPLCSFQSPWSSTSWSKWKAPPPWTSSPLRASAPLCLLAPSRCRSPPRRSHPQVLLPPDRWRAAPRASCPPVPTRCPPIRAWSPAIPVAISTWSAPWAAEKAHRGTASGRAVRCPLAMPLRPPILPLQRLGSSTWIGRRSSCQQNWLAPTMVRSLCYEHFVF